jgi:F420-0:gamma-glutamyl ligase-like protein
MLKKYLSEDGDFSLSSNIFISIAQLSFIQTSVFEKPKVIFILYKSLIRRY